MTYRARALPLLRTTPSNESTHSLVSSGSVSGNWVGSPSLMMEKRWRPTATSILPSALVAAGVPPGPGARAAGNRPAG